VSLVEQAQAAVAGGKPSTLHFAARTLDGVPSDMTESYGLRYRVYCLERKFLPAENYPTELETDEFDGHSIHVGAIDRLGTLAGTARVIRNTGAGLPVFKYCTIFPGETVMHPLHTVVEVSRLSVSRQYTRRKGDGPYGLAESSPPAHVNEGRRQVQGEVFLTLLKACYQASKRIGATHWLAATEASLQRILTRYGFPARQVGPESDYFGLVAPYAMDLQEFDRVILSGRFPVLDEFVEGLEPRFQPGSAQCT
jgi:N-acyl amino acid synthase of PEP-CTERM/exosortase system